MKQRGKQLIIAMLLMFIMIGSPNTSAEQTRPLIAIDLNDKVRAKEFYTDLDGKWMFFEQELLAPHEAEEQLRSGLGTEVLVPSSFESQTGDINSFGTYSAKINIPP